MTETLRQQLLTSPQLPSLPAIALQVLELAQRDEVDVAQIATVITRDPAITARILRTANSSFYARRNPVASINQALVLLGLQSVKTLVLGFSLVPTLSNGKPGRFDRERYWRRSLHAATAARILAVRAGLAAQQEETFLAALLADIGVLVLDRVLGERYHAIHAGASTHGELSQRERDALGTTHAEVAELLATAWRLPPVLREPIAFHHQPARASTPMLVRMTTIVELAGRIGDVFVDAASDTAVRDVRAAAQASLNFTADQADAMLAEVAVETRETASLFDMGLAESIDLAAALRRANEALVELTLQSQAQAVELTRENEALKVRASVDRLTGLANRMRFDEFLAERFADVSGGPLSIVMIDVDHFKSINDRFGHDAGDAVLIHLGDMLRGQARRADLAARYGGEELMLVLPNTTRTMAAQIAEQFRLAVASRPARGATGTIAMTVSLGVATREVGSPFREPAHLIKAADLAMYKAKHSGRNNVKVFTLAAPVMQTA